MLQRKHQIIVQWLCDYCGRILSMMCWQRPLRCPETAEKAIELKTGARALRSIMERIMLDVMYELPQTENVEKVVINRPVVEGRGKPKLHLRSPEDIEDAKKASSKDSPADAA